LQEDRAHQMQEAQERAEKRKNPLFLPFRSSNLERFGTQAAFFV
jgi:hypothetical protein